ncbi:LEA type 2 family protein [Echinimonas agarilytica]|uniref:LEA type 2 family protein n=1 Tax=Echinimonas agarilytica TaxID=1215918 RepID=A0AA41W8F6_9GAMM|nr:LEA type 2 family protein [Echinimonas agarilytica]MCM2680578.1 LEA type 2 family protein [Echinimonas agarilytica]
MNLGIAMHLPHIKQFFVVSFILAVLASCAALPQLDPPKVNLVHIKPTAGEGIAPRFDITLRVVNPNNTALSLNGAVYSLSLNGYEVVSGATSQLPEVPAYGEAQFTLPAELSLFQGMRLLSAMVRGSGDPTALNYEIDVKLDAGALLPDIRLKEEGSLNPNDLKASLSDQSL